MSDVWWFLTRATGIVATVLAVAALVWGLFFSARNTGNRRKPNWWLDLHNYLGGLALVFTAAHILAALLDSSSGIAILQVLVPGTADSSTWAITWGVVATYLFALTVFTSWPKRRFSRRVWRIVHLTSVFGVIVAIIHAFQLGTDASTRLFQASVLGLVAVGSYALALRLFGVIRRARAR